MEIQALPTKITESDAMKIAEQRGNIFGRLLLGRKDITLKLIYMESKEIVYRMEEQPIFPFHRRVGNTSRIRILVEGTRCSPAYLDEELQTFPVQISDKNQLQNSPFTEEKLVDAGRYLGRRMVRRQSGRNVALEPEQIRSIYRPYYIAFYGEWKEGTKIRYLPIPADGNEVCRVV